MMSSDNPPDAMPPDGDFMRLAGTRGGIARNRAIANAHSELIRLEPKLAKYIEQECQELITALSSAQMNVGVVQKAAITKAHECSERLRDVADSVSFWLVGFIANNICSIFDILAETGIAYPYAVLACHLDAFQLVQQRQYRNKKPPDYPQLTEGLNDALQIVKDIGAALTPLAPTLDP
jgi:hypothetical protein